MTFDVLEITQVGAALDHSKFLMFGLEQLRAENKAREEMSNDEFVVRMMSFLASKRGLLLLLQTPQKQNVGFLLAEDCSDFFRDSSMMIVALFVKDKFPSALAFLFERFLEKCQERKKTKVRAYTRRINGSAMKFYEDKLGFRREYVLFQRDVSGAENRNGG